MYRISTVLAAVSLLLFATGCNVFEPFYNDGASDDPDVLLEDARYALQSGDAARAVDLLEKAYAANPQSPEIRIELSSALFQANEIDLLLMKDLAEYISEGGDGATAGKMAGKMAGSPAQCSFGGAADAATLIRFEDEAAFVALFSNREVLERAIALLDDVLAADVDLDPNLLSNAHLMRAISKMATTVLAIQAKAEALGAGLYRIDGGIGYCAPDQDALDELQSYILCERLADIDTAVSDLAIRMRLLGSDSNELFDLLEAARDDFIAAINATCGIEVRVGG